MTVMVPEDATRSVWVAQHGTQNGVLLIDRLSDSDARLLCSRLLPLCPDHAFEVRDVHGQVVTTFQVRPPIKSTAPAPRRRPLGTRGQ